MSAASFDDLAELLPDTEGVLFVWQGEGAPRGGTLATLVPAALDALRSGAFRVDIELPDRRLLDGDMIRQLLTRWVGGAVSFVVDIEARQIFHQRSGAHFQIDQGDKLSLLSDHRLMPSIEWPLIKAGAAEALRQERGRDARVVGRFAWI